MNLSRILGLPIPWVFRQNWRVVPEYQLRCLIQGEDDPFLLSPMPETEIGMLKQEIYKQCDTNIFGGTLYRKLVIVKVDINLADREETLSTFDPGEVPALENWKKVSDIWVERPPIDDRIHIFVRRPAEVLPVHHISAPAGVPNVTLKVVCLDDLTLELEFDVEVHPITPIKMLRTRIRHRLSNFLIGEFYDSPLEILPLPLTPTLDQLLMQDVAELRKGAQGIMDNFPNDRVEKYFSQPGPDGVHFVVWLPPENHREPQNPIHVAHHLITLFLREFLNFEDATAASQGQTDAKFLFKALLKTEYHQFHQDDLFDMATGEYLPDEAIVASHIFLHKWGRRISHYTAFNDINDARNGLLLYKPVEWAFNRAKICISVNNAGRMIFHLLDHDLFHVRLADKACEFQTESRSRREGDLQTTFGDLDGKEVQFPSQSTTRPSKQLLAIHAVAAWVEAQGQIHDVELPIPECNTSDMDDAKFPFIEAWLKGNSIS